MAASERREVWAEDDEIRDFWHERYLVFYRDLPGGAVEYEGALMFVLSYENVPGSPSEWVVDDEFGRSGEPEGWRYSSFEALLADFRKMVLDGKAAWSDEFPRDRARMESQRAERKARAEATPSPSI